MTKEGRNEVLKEYCNSCKNPPYVRPKEEVALSDGGTAKAVTQNNYRIKALEIASEIGNSEFIKKCVECADKCREKM